MAFGYFATTFVVGDPLADIDVILESNIPVFKTAVPTPLEEESPIATWIVFTVIVEAVATVGVKSIITFDPDRYAL